MGICTPTGETAVQSVPNFSRMTSKGLSTEVERLPNLSENLQYWLQKDLAPHLTTRLAAVLTKSINEI